MEQQRLQQKEAPKAAIEDSPNESGKADEVKPNSAKKED